MRMIQISHLGGYERLLQPFPQTYDYTSFLYDIIEEAFLARSLVKQHGEYWGMY